MKTLNLLLMGCLLSVTARAQTVNLSAQRTQNHTTYLDALELTNMYDRKDLDIGERHSKFFNIVEKYGLNDHNISDNPFFEGYYPPRPPDMTIVPGDSSAVPTSTDPTPFDPKSIDKINLSGANWQAAAINGMATFMAGRFKEEVLASTITQVFKSIVTDSNKALYQALFPSTFPMLDSLHEKRLYYQADLIYLQQTVHLDLQKLPENMIQRSDIIFPKLNQYPDIKDLLLLSNTLVKGGKQSLPLDRIITSVSNTNYTSDSRVKQLANFLDLISQALLNEEGKEQIWVDPLEDLSLKSTTLSIKERYFYGLLYEQLRYNPLLISTLPNGADIKEIAKTIQHYLLVSTQLNNTYNYVRQREFDLKSTEEFFNYVTYIYESVQQLNRLVSNSGSQHRSGYQAHNYFVIADSVLNKGATYIQIYKTIADRNYTQTIPLLFSEFGSYLDNQSKVYKKALFVSQLASVQNADQMEGLMLSYALPIGGSAIKRNSSFNLSVNGYVGATFGFETAYGSEGTQTKGNIGLAAPIGISTTFFNGRATAFASIFDLGSVVNLRLNNDTTSYSDLKFEQFFTPGIGLYGNLFKLPVTLGFHVNFIPNLRTIKYQDGTAEITETGIHVNRYNVSVLVDIPFFTIYNRER